MGTPRTPNRAKTRGRKEKLFENEAALREFEGSRGLSPSAKAILASAADLGDWLAEALRRVRPHLDYVLREGTVLRRRLPKMFPPKEPTGDPAAIPSDLTQFMRYARLLHRFECAVHEVIDADRRLHDAARSLKDFFDEHAAETRELHGLERRRSGPAQNSQLAVIALVLLAAEQGGIDWSSPKALEGIMLAAGTHMPQEEFANDSKTAGGRRGNLKTLSKKAKKLLPALRRVQGLGIGRTIKRGKKLGQKDTGANDARSATRIDVEAGTPGGSGGRPRRTSAPPRPRKWMRDGASKRTS